MKVKLLDLDKPNLNGRIYPRQMLQQDIDKLTERSAAEGGAPLLYCYVDDNAYQSLTNISHAVKAFSIEGDELFAEVERLRTPKGELLEGIGIPDDRLQFAPRGYGTVAEDGTVSDYTLMSIDVIMG